MGRFGVVRSDGVAGASGRTAGIEAGAGAHSSQPRPRPSQPWRRAGQMSNLRNLAEFPLLEIWGDTVKARRIEGERITLAVVELAPNAVVPEHRHEHEQMGMVITGRMHFTIEGETRDLGPGGTW